MAAGFLGGHLTFAKGVGPDQTVFDPGPDEWTDAPARLPDGEPTRVVVDDTPVLLLRDGGRSSRSTTAARTAAARSRDGEIDGLRGRLRVPRLALRPAATGPSTRARRPRRSPRSRPASATGRSKFAAPADAEWETPWMAVRGVEDTQTVEHQAALLRVALLVARDAPQEELFTGRCRGDRAPVRRRVRLGRALRRRRARRGRRRLALAAAGAACRSTPRSTSTRHAPRMGQARATGEPVRVAGYERPPRPAADAHEARSVSRRRSPRRCCAAASVGRARGRRRRRGDAAARLRAAAVPARRAGRHRRSTTTTARAELAASRDAARPGRRRGAPAPRARAARGRAPARRRARAQAPGRARPRRRPTARWRTSCASCWPTRWRRARSSATSRAGCIRPCSPSAGSPPRCRRSSRSRGPGQHGELPGRRYADFVETTAYLMAAEALANVARPLARDRVHAARRRPRRPARSRDPRQRDRRRRAARRRRARVPGRPRGRDRRALHARLRPRRRHHRPRRDPGRALTILARHADPDASSPRSSLALVIAAPSAEARTYCGKVTMRYSYGSYDFKTYRIEGKITLPVGPARAAPEHPAQQGGARVGVHQARRAAAVRRRLRRPTGAEDFSRRVGAILPVAE